MARAAGIEPTRQDLESRRCSNRARMVWMTGIEPATCCFQNNRASTALHPDVENISIFQSSKTFKGTLVGPASPFYNEKDLPLSNTILKNRIETRSIGLVSIDFVICEIAFHKSIYTTQSVLLKKKENQRKNVIKSAMC